MDKIIPRWEWRTFGSRFGISEEKIQNHKLANFKRSTEKYILSRKSGDNCKIRDDLMDIKRLKQINGDKLEQWCPILKTSFPMRKESIETLFRDFFNADIPAFTRESYTYEQYLEEVVASCEDLEIVDVYKERSIYVINLAIVEIAEVTFNDTPTRTICVEHEDPQNVINTVRQLNLDRYENINYLRAMKDAVGMDS